MSETLSEMATKPIFDDLIVSEIAQVLEITDPEKRTHLATRLQRYSDRYYHGLQRQLIVMDGGELRQQMKATRSQIAKLDKGLRLLETSEEVRLGYRAARKDRGKAAPSSLERLRSELASMRDIADHIANGPQLGRGPKPRQILRHAVGSFMALFETITGKRADTSTYRDGEIGKYLRGSEGRALGLVFAHIDPVISEQTLAHLVAELREKFGKKRMFEGNFDTISKFEDAGGFEIACL